PFRKYYSEFHGLPEWVIEDPFREFPDSPPPLTPDQERALKEAVKNPNFRDLLEKRENGTIYVKVDSKVYKISLIKLFEPNKENHTGVVVAILPGDDIAQVLRAQNSMIIFYITANLLLILAVLAFWYQARIIKRKKREFETIVEIMGSGLILFDKKGTITYINDYGAKLLKYEKEALLGKMLDELLPLNGESLDKSPLKQAIMNGSAFTGDETLRCGDGSELVAFVVSRPLRIDQTFEGSIVSFVDISERIRFEKELFKTSLTDCLTGLYNRRFIEEELEKSRALSERYGIPFSVLMIDIDDFKKINDHFGHDVGDLVLKTLATVLKHNSREADSVARWGGEEFLVLLHNTNFEGALSIAERLRKTVASLRLKDIPSFTISIGVTSFKKGESIESLLRRVDTALYEAKKAGKNTTVGAIE
ncbi:MAG: sensor domain-containing diguanylate cyclase, partial [Sulfolobales archaeon]